MADLFEIAISIDSSAAVEGSQAAARAIAGVGEAAELTAGRAGGAFDTITESLTQTLVAVGAIGDITTGVTGIATEAQKASTGVGQMRDAIAGLAADALGVAPELMSIAAVLGTMTVGAPVTVGVLTALTALGYGWQFVTRESRAAKEATEEAIRVHDQIIERQRLGAGGAPAKAGEQFARDVGTKSDQLNDLYDRRFEAQEAARAAAAARTSAPNTTFAGGYVISEASRPGAQRSFSGYPLSETPRPSWTPWDDKNLRKLEKDQKDLIAKYKVVHAEANRRIEQESIPALARLLTAGHAKGEDLKEARRLFAARQRTVAEGRGGAVDRATAAGEMDMLAQGLEAWEELQRQRRAQAQYQRVDKLLGQQALPRIQVTPGLIESARALPQLTPIAALPGVGAPTVDVGPVQEQAEKMRAPFDKARKGIEQGFGDLFAGIIQNGASAFDDFAKTAKSIVARLISDMLSMFLSKRLQPALMGMFGISPTGGASPGGGGIPGLGGTFGRGLAGGLAGGVVGYAVGSMTTNRALGALGGAASGAAAGASVGGLPGAIVGGVVGFVGGLFGSSQKAKEAARQMREAQRQWGQALKDFVDAATEMPDHVRREKEINRKSLDLMMQGMQAFGVKDPNKLLKRLGFDPNAMTGSPEEIARVIQQLEQLAKLPRMFRPEGGKHLNEVIAQMKKLAEAQGLNLDALNKARQEQEKTVRDDLAVRELAAKGMDKDADALRLKLQHQREYQEAEKQNYDAATLAQLRHVQALEAAKQAADAATTSMLNVPEGFRLAAAAFRAQDPFTSTTSGPPILQGWPGPHANPTYPTFGPISDGDDRGGGRGEDDRDVVLQLDGREVARVAVHHLRRKARQQFGDETRWGEVSEA